MGATSWSHIPYAVRQRITAQVFQRDGHRCQMRGARCNGRAQEVDHITPIVHGGNPLDLTNMRAACRPCNRAAGAKLTNSRHKAIKRQW